MKKSLLTAVTLVMLSTGAHANFTASDLERIESLVNSQRWAALNAYILENPQLLQGDNALVTELVVFRRTFREGFFDRLSNPPTPPSLNVISTLTEQY
ncbi:MAG: hypothetical protein AAF092_10800 [Pseudomonadota bacterium]